MIVLDASTAVELLLGGRRAERVLPSIEAHEAELHAPDLLDVEVVQVVRRLVLSGAMDVARGGACVEMLGDLPVTRHPAGPLLPRMWELRENLSAYDAAYVALAEGLGCGLLTLDGALARSPGLTIEVELLPTSRPGP